MAAGVVLSAVSACGSGAVEVDDVDLPSGDREKCEALVEALPPTVDDQPRREVTGNDLATAYGDPPIVVRCGVPLPEDWKFAWCQTANGVDWHLADEEKVFEDQSLDVVITLLHRTPTLEVRIPAEYRPPTTAMIDLEKAIKAHTEKTGACTKAS